MRTSRSNHPPGSPLHRLRINTLEAWAIWVGVESELFKWLIEPISTADLAVKADMDASALEALLRALASTGHLDRDEEAQTFCLTEPSRAYLLPDGGAYLGDSFGFLRTSHLFSSYPRLLKHGGGLELSSEEWDHVTRGSSAYLKPAVRALIEDVPALSQGGTRVLDVGCGRGDYSRALITHNPELLITAIDPVTSVAETARERLEDLPQVDVRCAFVEDVKETFDIVLVNHVVHVVGDEVSQHILRQCGERAGADGTVLVQELVETASNQGALFGLMMRLLFEGGKVYSRQSLEALIGASGLDVVRHIAVGRAGSGLLFVEARPTASGDES